MKSIHFHRKSFVHSLVFLSFTSFAIDAEEKETPKTKLEYTLPFTKTGEAKVSVVYLKDAAGNNFVLKNHYSPKYAIHETIATQVGESVGININHLEIFSKENLSFDKYVGNKYVKKGIKTLHTHMPGCVVREEKSMHDKINVYRGLSNYDNLTTLAQFINLCDIVALDIFTNNFDRNNGNIFIVQNSRRLCTFDTDFFIDQKMDPEFYAIDMDHAFNNILDLSSDKISSGCELDFILSDDLLATRTYNFLEEQKEIHLYVHGSASKEKIFSSAEIKALKRVNKVLGKMMNEYTPEKLYNEWMDIAEKVNYTYTPNKKENIKIALEYNFHECRRLHSKIDELTA